MTVAELTETDVELDDGRVLHCYDTGGGDVTVMWHHGVPTTGQPPAPLLAPARRLGVRFLSYDRPGYGGSSQLRDRDVASSARDAEAVLDAFGAGRCAMIGHSGGGPAVLACAALLADRVGAAATVAGPAPFDAAGLDWFGGMSAGAASGIRAATEGRVAKERHEAGQPANRDPGFTAADYDALAGDWSWFTEVVVPAGHPGGGGFRSGGAVEDNLALVAPWAFDPASIEVPLLVVHGGGDEVIPPAHATWLAGAVRRAELWLRPGEGHITVLREGERALEWLARKV